MFAMTFVAVAQMFSASAAPSNYHIIDLGMHIAGIPKVLDINNKNQVVGYILGYDSMRIAFVFKNGVTRLLPPLDSGCECIAEGINDAGMMTGYAYTQPGRGRDDNRIYHAVLWDTGGRISDLGTMGGFRSVAYDINNAGQVAGWFATSQACPYFGTTPGCGYVEHIYLWQNGAYRELTLDSTIYGHQGQDCFSSVLFQRNDALLLPPQNQYTLADEITLNNNGDVATTLVSNSIPSRSVLWKHNGDQVDLNAGLLPCGYNVDSTLFEPMVLNDSLVMVGFCLSWKVKYGIFTSVTRTYNTLEYTSPATCYRKLQLNTTNAINEPCINNKGVIAGTYNNFPGAISPTYSKAVLWQNDSVFVLENYVLGRDTMTYHSLDAARVINDSGTIAGEGIFGYVVPSAFLLIPESPKIVMPTLGKFTITLTQASAKLVSDVYLYRPDSVLMIQNNLQNVGKTYDTVYPAGTALQFAICVHPPAGKGSPYWFTSDSKHAIVTKANDSLMYVNFEDLPDSVADWDYNDVVLKVELHLLGPLPSDARHVSRVTSCLQRNETVDAFDLRGRFLGSCIIDRAGKLVDNSGRRVYGVLIARPQNGFVKRITALE
jgi:hypothetical protein